MQSNNFLAGINVTGADVREWPNKIVELLANTPIKWLRVHPLPNRILEEKGPSGLSYIEGIEHLCKNGYNIVAPIEVGYTLNTGPISINNIEKLVDEDSYRESFIAAKRISEVAQRNNADIIFCVENEIDAKSWFLQALPGIEWRASFETWAKQAADFDLKYRRLNNILKGIKDAQPAAKTLANIVAEDARVYLNSFVDKIMQHADRLREQDIQLEKILDETIDWKVELKYINNCLNVDYIGLDTYANWIIKYPIYGHETASKVEEARLLTSKPIVNAEFGYTTYRNNLEKIIFLIMGRLNASKMQLQFFKNTLSSIESSSSMGTFPWVLITHPDMAAIPEQEAYFGLFKMKHQMLKKEPAFDYYVDWLRKKGNKQ